MDETPRKMHRLLARARSLRDRLLRPRMLAQARDFREWLLRPRTVRVLAPAGVLLGGALVVVGILVFPSGGDGPSSPAGDAATSGDILNGVPGVAYPVPPEMVEGVRYLVPPLQTSAGFNIQIDALGVDARVVRLGLTSDRIPQVPNSAAIVAWYEFSAVPGRGSNAVLAGHVRWAGDRGVFADLRKLEDGDTVRLKWNDGRVSVYEVVDNFEVDPKDPSSLRVMDPTDDDVLTLITCGGTFVPDNQSPLGGDFTERTVVRARLVQPAVFSR